MLGDRFATVDGADNSIFRYHEEITKEIEMLSKQVCFSFRETLPYNGNFVIQIKWLVTRIQRCHTMEILLYKLNGWLQQFESFS